MEQELLTELVGEVKALRVAVEANRPMGEGALTRERAARYLGISTRQLDKLASDGDVPRTRVRGKTVFQRKNLDAYLDNCTEMSGQEVERHVARL